MTTLHDALMCWAAYELSTKLSGPAKKPLPKSRRLGSGSWKQ